MAAPVRGASSDSVGSERFRRVSVFALNGHGHSAAVAGPAMLPKIDALLIAQSAAPGRDRDRQAGLSQDGADVGRHVIRSFVGVFEPRRAVGD